MYLEAYCRGYIVGNSQISLGESCSWLWKARGADLILSESHGGFTDDFAKASAGPLDAMQQNIWEVLAFNTLDVIMRNETITS